MTVDPVTDQCGGDRDHVPHVWYADSLGLIARRAGEPRHCPGPITDPEVLALRDGPDGPFAQRRERSDPRSTSKIVSCDHGLIPLGKDDAAPCVLPWGHGGLHETARGVKWAGHLGRGSLTEDAP